MPLQKNLLHPLIFDPSQEVDRFQDLEEELALRGYNGVWKVVKIFLVYSCLFPLWSSRPFH